MLQTNWKMYIYYVCLSHGGVLETIRRTNTNIFSQQLFWVICSLRMTSFMTSLLRRVIWELRLLLKKMNHRRWRWTDLLIETAILLLAASRSSDGLLPPVLSALSSAPTPVKWSRDSASPPLSYGDQSTEIFSLNLKYFCQYFCYIPLQCIVENLPVFGNHSHRQLVIGASHWKSFVKTTSW